MYHRPKGKKAELIPVATDKFRLGHSLTQVEFTRDASGKVVSLTESSTGMPITLILTNKPVEQRKEIQVAARVLQGYTGNYQLKPGVIFIVTQQESKLYGQMSGPGQTRQELIPYAKDKFYAQNTDATVEFTFGKDKKATGLTLTQNDKKNAVKVN